MLCREWFNYTRKALRTLGVEYDDCPQVCGNREPKIDIHRSRSCEKCPLVVKRQEFRRKTERLWELWLPETDLRSLNFEKMLEHLYRVLAVRGISKGRRPALAQRYIDILDAEKSRYERLERQTG